MSRYAQYFGQSEPEEDQEAGSSVYDRYFHAGNQDIDPGRPLIEREGLGSAAWRGPLAGAAGAAGSGLMGLAETTRDWQMDRMNPLAGLGASAMDWAGEKLSGVGERAMEGIPESQRGTWFAEEFAPGVGSMGTFIAGGTAGRGLGLLQAGARRLTGQAAVRSGQVGQFGFAAPVAWGAGYDEAGQRMMQFIQENPDLDLDYDSIHGLAARAGGGVSGLVQIANLNAFLNPLVPQSARRPLLSAITQRLAVAGASEAAVEGTGGLIQNLVQSTYDGDQDLMADVLSRAGTGGAVGLAAAVLMLPFQSRGFSGRITRDQIEERVRNGEDPQQIMSEVIDRVDPELLDEATRRGDFNLDLGVMEAVDVPASDVDVFMDGQPVAGRTFEQEQAWTQQRESDQLDAQLRREFDFQRAQEDQQRQVDRDFLPAQAQAHAQDPLQYVPEPERASPIAVAMERAGITPGLLAQTSPEFQAGLASGIQQLESRRQPEAQPAAVDRSPQRSETDNLVMRANGRPFPTEGAARRSAEQRNIQGRAVPVDGGYAIQPVTDQDRRQDTESRKQFDQDIAEIDFDALPPDQRREQFQRVQNEYRTTRENLERSEKQRRSDKLTGLPNLDAFEEDIATNPPEAVMFADLDDFKRTNDELQHSGADRVLSMVGEVMNAVAEEMGVSPYRRSGDEFFATGADQETLNRYGEEVQRRISSAIVKVRLPDGTVREWSGSGLSFGVGENADTAESVSNQQKEQRKAAGLRQGTRDPERVAKDASAGQRDNQRRTAEETRVAEEQAQPEPVQETESAEPRPGQGDLVGPREVEQAAAEADPNPTEAQTEAGNYRMGHVSLHGLDITIEKPRGSMRRGRDRKGNAWEQEMAHHYGYIKRTEGSDGEHVDVYLGPLAEDASAPVFIINQVRPDSGQFDEHKVMIGFADEAVAREGYLANYQDGWQGLGSLDQMSMAGFKDWLETQTPATEAERPPVEESPPEQPAQESPETPPESGVSASGPRYSFAGERAQTADHGQLADARRRLEAGEDTEAVRQETGWFRGDDGEWRFEIDDSQASLKQAIDTLGQGERVGQTIRSVTYRQEPDGTWAVRMVPEGARRTEDIISLANADESLVRALVPDAVFDRMRRGDGERDMIELTDEPNALRIEGSFPLSDFNALPLDQVLEHDALFEAYPDLRDVMVQVDPIARSGGAIMLTDDGTVIRIGRAGRKRQLSTIIHEVQHGIQEIEGFARGGTAREFQPNRDISRKDMMLAQNEARRLYEEFREEANRQRDEPLPAWLDTDAETRRDFMERASQRLYERLSGEVEARNVQARQGMTADERRQSSPGQTRDVPADESIVRTDRSEVQRLEPESFREAFTPRAQRTLFDSGLVTITESPSQWPGNHPADAAGAWINGKIYLATNNIAAGSESGLILHEVGVHHGLRDMLGDDYQRLVKQLQRQVERGSRPGATRAQREAYEAHQRALADDTIQSDAARWEETIAYMAEAGADSSLFRQIVAAIRNFLRNLGLVRGFDNADVADLARGSVARIVDGVEGQQGQSYAPAMYQRAEQAETADQAQTPGTRYSRQLNEDAGFAREADGIRIAENMAEVQGDPLLEGIDGDVVAVFDASTQRGLIVNAGKDTPLLLAQEMGYRSNPDEILGSVLQRRLGRESGDDAIGLILDSSTWNTSDNVRKALTRAKTHLAKIHGVQGASDEIAARFLAGTLTQPDGVVVIRPPDTVDRTPTRQPGDPVADVSVGEDVTLPTGADTQVAAGVPDRAIGKLRDKRSSWLGWTRLFESASDNFRNTTGAEFLATAIDGYFDGAKRYEAEMKAIMAPALRQFRKLSKADRKTAEEAFGRYFQAVTYGRDPQSVYRNAPQAAKDLIDAWTEVGRKTGDMNQELGVQVRDGNTWRPIGRVETYFPRVPSEEVTAALSNPEAHPEKWNELVDALMAEGRIKDESEAAEYIREQTVPDQTKSDFFSAMEVARKQALPDAFYDWTMAPALQYVESWSDRYSQIEQFGQNTGDGDLFDSALGMTFNEQTKNYIKAAKDRIYNVVPNDIWMRALQTMNTIATGTQLANPATSTLNVIGGTTLNWMAYGEAANLKAFKDLVSDVPGMLKYAREIGVLREDYLKLTQDMGANDTIRTLMGKPINTGRQLRRAVSFLMKYGGYMPTEHWIRMHAMLAGKHFYLQALEANKRPNTAKAKRYRMFMERNGFDFDQLARDGLNSKYGERWLRYASNLTQGTYRIDQTPVFVDTPIGRFLFKYQKFGTQVNRLVWKNHLEPFVKSVAGGEKLKSGERVKTFVPMMRFFVSTAVGGAAIGWAREVLFDYMRPGPGFDELEEALEDDDRARSLALMASFAYHKMNTAGAFGIIGNYTQFFRDFSQQERVKNPLDPPGLAAIDAMADLSFRMVGQRSEQNPVGLNARDIDEVTERFFSAYRTFKRPAIKAIGAMDADYEQAKVQAAIRDRRYIAGVSARFASDAGIETGRSISGGRYIPTPMTPINREIVDALRAGNPAKARAVMNQHLATLPSEERDRAMQSIRARVRNSQPLTLGGRAMSNRQRDEFMAWARDRVGPENFERIRRNDMEYQRAARAAGLM